jgi:putative transposase
VKEYPQRLHHETPPWVKTGALFHIRIRAVAIQRRALISADIGPALLRSTRRYHAAGSWWCELFLLMPDHLHALLRFPPARGMSEVMRDWKRGAARLQKVEWQENFFDHRIRTSAEGLAKWHYIRRNPVVKGLCADEDDWPHWWTPTGTCGL